MGSARPPVLVAFALGVLHTVVLLVALGWLVYRTGRLGEGLAEIGTLIGLGIFALLWAAIGTFTLLAVRPFRFSNVTPGVALGRGALWGGYTGFGFFAPLLLFGLGATVVSLFGGGPGEAVRNLGALAFIGVIGSIVAFAFGAAVGVAFALVDVALLAASSRVADGGGAVTRASEAGSAADG